MKWFFFPPVISSLLLALTVILHNRDAAIHIPAIVWGLTIAAYISLCGVSVYFISKNESRYNIGIALLSQGLLLSVMSLQFGVFFLAWLGLILFLAGLIMVFFYATQGSSAMLSVAPVVEELESRLEAEREKTERVLTKLEIPLCVTDSKGIIYSATPRFYDALEKKQGEIEGEIISDVLPINEEEVVLPSGRWWIFQMKEGAKHYFSLLPTPNGMPMEDNASGIQAVAPVGPSIFDPATGLYTDEYRRIRGPEEVSRAQRYKRSLSGVLLELDFHPTGDVSLSENQKEMLRTAFAARVKTTLRSMDCGFIMQDQRVQLLLPETPQAGAKTLLSRLLTLPQDVFDDDIRAAVNPKVKAGLFFYNGAIKMEYGIFSATLEESFAKSKEGTASQAA